jgi:hypothetical protein
MLTFEKNKFAELEKMLSLVGAGLQWKATSGTSGLWFLPLAISLEAAGSPGFMNAEELALAHSLAIEHWPTDEVRFLGEAFKGSVLDRVSKFSWLNESEVKDLINRVNNIPVG